MKKTVFVVLFLLLLVSASLAAEEKFPLKDVTVESISGMAMVQGEITNNSGKAYNTAIFKISFYDGNGKLVGVADFAIENFSVGETVTFDGVGTKEIKGWKTYKVRLDMSA